MQLKREMFDLNYCVMFAKANTSHKWHEPRAIVDEREKLFDRQMGAALERIYIVYTGFIPLSAITAWNRDSLYFRQAHQGINVSLVCICEPALWFRQNCTFKNAELNAADVEEFHFYNNQLTTLLKVSTHSIFFRKGSCWILLLFDQPQTRKLCVRVVPWRLLAFLDLLYRRRWCLCCVRRRVAMS